MMFTRPSRPLFLAALLVVAGALTAGGCSKAPRPHSALLVTIDTTRMDALSLYGVTQGVTPGLDALAREMLVYEDARTTVPLTLPSHASMLTGLYPPRHTLRVNGKRPLPSGAHTLAEAASEAGAQTAAFLAAVVLAPEFGLDQGFERYQVPERANRATSFYDERPANEVVDQALAWLGSRDRERPFFLWVHLFDPHEPYEPPPPYATGSPDATDRVQRYLGEVSYVDHELSRLFGAMRDDGTLDETFVLICADHGEGLGEHGEASHGDYCNESTLRIPFLVRYPDGTRAGERSDELVSLVDVAPTLAEAMGLSLGAGLDGVSLYRNHVPPERGVYFESYAPFTAFGWAPITGWLQEGGKYVHTAKPRFFDLAQDPGEEHDLSRSADLSRHRAAIAALAARPTLEEASSEEIDDELRARIQGLGYAGVDDDERALPDLLAPTGLRDPIDSVGLHAELIRAYSLLSAGLYAECSAAFEGVLAEDPRNAFALDHLATSLIREGRFEDAVDALQRLIALGTRKAGVFFNLGVSLHRLGRLGEARSAFERAQELAPDEPRIQRYLEELGG